jgi:hypothetical protein
MDKINRKWGHVQCRSRNIYTSGRSHNEYFPIYSYWNFALFE